MPDSIPSKFLHCSWHQQWTFPLILFLLVAGGSFLLWWEMEQVELQRWEIETDVTVQQVRLRLEAWIDARIDILNHLAERWADTYSSNPQTYREEAFAFLDRHSGIQALNWIDANWVIQITVPQEGNEPALGKDLHLHPSPGVTNAILQSIRTRQITRTPVVDLLQGGKGFATYRPVFDENQAIIGFINGVFRVNELVSRCLAEPTLREQFRFILREETGNIVYGQQDSHQVDEWPYQKDLPVRILDSPWKLSIAPSPAYLKQVHTTANDFLLGGGVLLAGVVAWLFRTLLLRQEALKQSEAQNHAILDAIPDLMFRQKRDGTYIDFKAGSEDLLATPKDQIIGRNIKDTGLPQKYIHQVLDSIKQALDTHTLQTLEYQLQVPAGLKDFEARITPLAEDEVLYIVRDITARKQAEAERRISDNRLRAILDYSPALISIKDLEGNLLLVNRRFEVLAGPTLDEYRGKNVYAVFPPEIAGALWNNDLAALKTGGPVEVEEVFKHQDGSLHTYLTIKFPLINEDRESYGICAISTDITDRKRAEESRRILEGQMQHAQKLESLGILAGGIAHDFNNLLMVILGNIDLALRDLAQESPLRPRLVEIEKASQRAADLTRQMLAYSGRGHFIVQAVDLSVIVDEMTHLLKSSISKKVMLKMQLAPDLPYIKADIAQMQQIIMNLITNASEAIGSDNIGLVTISTGEMECHSDDLGQSYLNEKHAEGKYVYLEVSDTGCGMDEETKSRIFDPFFSTKFTGRGLGLAAVLGIVRGHQGLLTVMSKPALGTTFRVLFPSFSKKADRVFDKKQLAEPDKWHGDETILIVDDEKSVRETAKSMLEHLGFSVLTAKDGFEAIYLYQKHSTEVDCILLDLTMPLMDGAQAYREIRRINKNVQIILSSGFSEEECLERFPGKDLSGFIQKPYKMNDLIAILKQILGKRP